MSDWARVFAIKMLSIISPVNSQPTLNNLHVKQKKKKKDQFFFFK